MSVAGREVPRVAAELSGATLPSAAGAAGAEPVAEGSGHSSAQAALMPHQHSWLCLCACGQPWARGICPLEPPNAAQLAPAWAQLSLSSSACQVRDLSQKVRKEKRCRGFTLQ